MKASRYLGAIICVCLVGALLLANPASAFAADFAHHVPVLAHHGLHGVALASLGLGAADVDLKQLAADFTKATDEVKNLAEDLQKKYESGATVSQEAKDKADQALTNMNELKARLDEAEQKLARRGSVAIDLPKSIGVQVSDSDVLKDYAQRRGRAGRATIDVTGMHATITSAAGSGGALLQDQRISGIIPTPERRMTVRDLLTPGRTGAQSITYYRETGFTNSAAVVSENTTKPESNITFESVTQNVATIAHWVKASKQILADVPMLQSFIDGRLMYGLAYEEEQQLLNGDGTGENLEGLVTAATAYSAPFAVSGATMIDQVRLAALQAVLAEYPATGIVMNPTDWARIELTKDNEGRYIIGQPQGDAQPRLWRLPVVETQAMAVDKFLAGAFKLGAQIFDREDGAVTMSDEDGDNFVKNMVTILAEERLALAIYRPEAFIYGDFGNV